MAEYPKFISHASAERQEALRRLWRRKEGIRQQLRSLEVAMEEFVGQENMDRDGGKQYGPAALEHLRSVAASIESSARDLRQCIPVR